VNEVTRAPGKKGKTLAGVGFDSPSQRKSFPPGVIRPHASTSSPYLSVRSHLCFASGFSRKLAAKIEANNERRQTWGKRKQN
jgi:hypothetical protein